MVLNIIKLVFKMVNAKFFRSVDGNALNIGSYKHRHLLIFSFSPGSFFN